MTGPMTGPILILDGYSLLFRAFHALPPMCTKAGVPTGALYGVSVLLLKLLREERPSGLVVTIDAPMQTHRRAAYAGYKAGRAAAPDPLRSQILRFPELAAALGVPLHQVPGWEADDVIATLTRRLRPTLVVSGDTDLLQVVNDDTKVLFVGQRQKDHIRYDVAQVHARYGIRPEGMPTWKALAGDPSDNLPGIAGIGGKTATKLVAEHGDAASILAARERIGPPRVRAALDGALDALPRWEALGRLETDLALPEPLWAPIASYDGLRAWFAELEFASLVARVDKLAEQDQRGAPATTAANAS